MPFRVKKNTLVQMPGYPLTSQTVSYDATTQSAAFNTKTHMVRLRATTDCYIAFGANPTATSSTHFLAAGETQDFAVFGGDKVAAIKSSVAGSLFVSEFEIALE